MFSKQAYDLLPGPSDFNLVAAFLSDSRALNGNKQTASYDRDQHEPGPGPEPPAFQ
jgi:hypothetical protein